MASTTAWGLPVPNPCLSFWQQTTRSFPYLNANAVGPIPSGEDGSIQYAIIGSGISGALTAFELLEAGVPPHAVVILEAREAASGASSRNAGHVRPDAFRGFAPYARIHGAEQALKILANEREVFHRLEAFVKKHDVPSDFHATTTFDVCLTPSFAEFLARSFAEYRAAGGDVSHITVHADAASAARRTGVRAALAAYEWPAGSSHPAKLAQWLLARCAERGVRLLTHCPVTAVTAAAAAAEEGGEGGGGGGWWRLTTPRGALRAREVVHCTNAHAAHLLPGLAPFLTPNRAQAHALVPPPELTGKEGAMGSTMSLRYGLRHFYSVIQRPADGIVILGCSRSNPNLSEETMAGTVSADDSVGFSREIRDDAMAQFWSTMLGGGDDDDDDDYDATPPDGEKVDDGMPGRRSAAGPDLRHGEGLLHAWTGIIGLTSDTCPFVGRVPGAEGQWVCAGFNGHGMARIFTCAPGLVKVMRGAAWSDTGLPECFEINEERLEKLRRTSAENGAW
ncbi:FAD dependent oxidoreductase [Xylariaceae sp. FL0804]|nr:FAD dependent oxidoreductase [Xylariaceae sp. FL0804]